MRRPRPTTPYHAFANVSFFEILFFFHEQTPRETRWCCDRTMGLRIVVYGSASKVAYARAPDRPSRCRPPALPASSRSPRPCPRPVPCPPQDTPQAFKDASFELGRLLAQRGHICVNGGGNTGCMGALSDGCLQHGGKVRGGGRAGGCRSRTACAPRPARAHVRSLCQVVGVIHEMFVVDGEEHTGVSEMLVCPCAHVPRLRLRVRGEHAVRF